MPDADYKASVEKDLRKLSRRDAGRILTAIADADVDSGEPLSGPFAGLFRYRVGDHRVVFARVKARWLILRISHRSEVYMRGVPER